ncbi:MAG: hypothetical protein KJ646_00150 [Nanoarchaeota archaeon]|nr:hypothetical protein [Nanoarchaeota archaeon]MBU4116537.1 hypothetical protein [Nanoarchaeota archaeon]
MNYLQSAIKDVRNLFAIPIVTALILGGPLIRNGLEKIISHPISTPAICIQNNDYAPEIANSEIELLAKAIYGEARGELDNLKYLKGVIGSIKTRAKKTGKSIREIILEKRVNEKKGKTHHYTCFDPTNVNYKKIKELSNTQENEIWDKCYLLAEKALNNELDLPKVTNYFVGKNPQKHKTKKQAEKMKIPSWAFKMENGNFVLDENKKRIPVKPTYIVKIDENKSAYFYNFKYF